MSASFVGGAKSTARFFGGGIRVVMVISTALEKKQMLYN